MIIRINAMGKVTLVSGAALTQGSSLSNELFFEAPISGAASCNVYFTLPNGAHVGPYYADYCNGDSTFGINTWHLIIDAAITQYAGELCVHADFMQGEQVLATADCRTTIRRGAYRSSLVLGDNSDKYLEGISKAFADGANAFYHIIAAIGAESVRVWYAWKHLTLASAPILYTSQRHPSTNDPMYRINSSQEMVQSGRVMEYDGDHRLTPQLNGGISNYSEADNLIELIKNENAPEGTIFKRLGDIEAFLTNAVRFTDLATGGKYGLVKSGMGYGVCINNGEVVLLPASPSEIDTYRNGSDIFADDPIRSNAITLGNYRYAMRRAAVDASTVLESPISPYKEYYLGVRQSLTLVFPSINAVPGDRVYIQWISGTTPTTLTIDESNTSKIDFEPRSNQVCEIQGVYGLIGYSAGGVEYGWNLVARQSPAEVF